MSKSKTRFIRAVVFKTVYAVLVLGFMLLVFFYEFRPSRENNATAHSVATVTLPALAVLAFLLVYDCFDGTLFKTGHIERRIYYYLIIVIPIVWFFLYIYCQQF